MALEGCAADFIEALQETDVLPHVAQHIAGRRSAVPRALAEQAGYPDRAAQARGEKRLGRGQSHWKYRSGDATWRGVRGLGKVDQRLVLNMAPFNLVRMRTLG